MLKVVSTEKAKEIIKENFAEIKAREEMISVSDCLGRVLYSDITAKENVPAFDRSTVDGFAVKASDTYGSSESMPAQLSVAGEIFMGEKADMTIHDGECVRIATGGMLPEGADSVVMVEHTDTAFEDFCLIFKSVSPFENVTKKGDDIKENQVVFRKGRTLTSREVGAFASLGISKIPVAKKPRVGIISTGDEIVPVDGSVPFGKIRDINSHILFSLFKELGCDGTEYGIIADKYDDIYFSVKKAVSENDIVIISGGSSAGVRDMTADIISSLGEVYIHGIAMKPGKPTIVGKIDGKAVFGLPGHPAAAYFVALRLIKPLVDSILGRKENNNTVKGRLTQNISSNHGREEIICIKVSGEDAEPVFGKSGVISLLSQSNGYIVIDRNCEGLKKGDEVNIFLF